MAPTPAPTAAVPHANAQPVYNPPRAPEVYTLADGIDAAIPAEVRDQFQRDEQGRILFFTTPPLNRANNGVTEQYAGLGHSASHLANIKKLREERIRKRTERDEAQALEEAANKKRAANKEALSRVRAELQQKQAIKNAQNQLFEWCKKMDEDTQRLKEELGDWEGEKQKAREESKGLTDKERRVNNLQWFFDNMANDSDITPEQKKHYEETFIQRKQLHEVAQATAKMHAGEA